MLFIHKLNKTSVFRALSFAFIIMMFSGCGDGVSENSATPNTSGTPAAVTITSVAITPAAVSVAIGQIANLTAISTYSDASTADITNQATWAIANPAVATININTGVVTGVALGSTTVTASINGSIISPSIPVTVAATGISGIITITPSSASEAKGIPVTFTATDNTGGNVSGSVAWASSNSAVATVNASGIASTRSQGSTYITASANGSTSNSALLTVTPPVLTAISITPSPASVPIGLPTQLSAIGLFTDGLQIDITSQVTWAVADPTVASVNNGLVTGLLLGSSTTITASFLGLVTSPAATVTVSAAALTGISITPPAASTPIGTPFTFTATGTYSDGSTGNVSGSVTWLSSNGAVATVNASGIATPLVVGTTNIMAWTGSIVSNTVVLTVNPVPVIPSGPAVVTAVSAPGQVTLTWSPEINATSYNLYWGSSSGITTASTKVAGVTSPYVLPGLTDGSTYYFRVSTVNPLGETLAAEIFSYLYVGGEPAGTFTVSTASTMVGSGTLLPDGNVLFNNQLYNSATDSSSPTAGSMSAGSRSRHTATLLPNGLVLIAGGATNTPSAVASSTAELFNPATGTYSNSAGSMSQQRKYHSATLLPNGTVLIVGGMDASGVAAFSADIYDPATDTFSPTANSLTYARRSHTATLLPSGKVLITGGRDWSTTYLYTAEIYDPATGLFTALTSLMKRNRAEHTATLLPNGKVLLTGGYGGTALTIAYNSNAELFDPATSGFTLLVSTMSNARWGHPATLLPNGKVLVTGGYFGSVTSLGVSSADIYDPATNTFSATGTMTQKRHINTSTSLPNGKVLVNGGGALSTAELFQ